MTCIVLNALLVKRFRYQTCAVLPKLGNSASYESLPFRNESLAAAVAKRSTSQEGCFAPTASRASFKARAKTKSQKGQTETAKTEGISGTVFTHFLASFQLDRIGSHQRIPTGFHHPAQGCFVPTKLPWVHPAQPSRQP